MGAAESAREERAVRALCAEDYFAGYDHVPYLCPYSPEMAKLMRPARDVMVDDFLIDRFEVTVGSYRECADAGRCSAAPLTGGDQRYHESALPVVNVTFGDARDYCEWRRKRLPTEAEWEKAARGADGRRWPWGNTWLEGGINHGAVEGEAMGQVHGRGLLGLRGTEIQADASDGYFASAPPGSFPFGQSPYGALDMAGNVAEWVADAWSEEGYEKLSASNPLRVASTESALRVVRGGSWLKPRLWGLTYHRDIREPSRRYIDVGFRCARDARRRPLAPGRRNMLRKSAK